MKNKGGAHVKDAGEGVGDDDSENMPDDDDVADGWELLSHRHNQGDPLIEEGLLAGIDKNKITGKS